MCLAEQNLVLYGAIEKLVERLVEKPSKGENPEIIGEDGWPK